MSIQATEEVEVSCLDELDALVRVSITYVGDSAGDYGGQDEGEFVTFAGQRGRLWGGGGSKMRGVEWGATGIVV